MYESGFLVESTGKRKWVLRGRDYGVLSLVEDHLFFSGRKGREITIELKNINNLKVNANTVEIYLRGGKQYNFHILNQYKNSLMETIRFRQKAKQLYQILNHLLQK